jgi:hypothetical protein
MGEGGSLTCSDVDSDNDMRRHRLDDVACLLTCHVVFTIRRVLVI